MTVTNTGTIVAYTGNGVQTQFPFSFPVSPARQELLHVYLQDSTTFVTTHELSNSEFSVVFQPTGDGTVVYSPGGVPLPSTRRIVIERQVPYIQELELTKYGAYDGVAIMQALDRQEMQIQQLVSDVDQAVKVPYGTDSDDLVDLIQAAAGYAEDAEAAAEQAQGYAQQAAQYMADATELVEIIDAVIPDVQRFSGDGVETEFTLSNPLIAANAINVYITGVYQQKDTYDVIDGVLTFSAAPPTGTNNIEVVMAGAMAVVEPPAGTTWITVVDVLPDLNNFEGRTVYLTTNDKLHTWDGEQWNSVGGGDGGGGGGIPDYGYIEPVTELPSTDNFNGRTVYNLLDSRVYIYIALGWTAIMGEDGGGGGGGEPTLPDDASYMYIYAELPAEGLFIGQLAYQELDGKLYTWDGTEWQPLVTGEDVNFPDGFTGVQIVTTLPASDNFEGRIVYLNTDGKLYRYTATGWTRETAAADIAGQITSTQIGDDSISTPKLQAGSIVASKMSANSVTSDAILAGAILTAKLAAGAVTADKIAASAITADKIQAGAVTAAKVNVTNLAALSATLGAVNISSAIMGSLTVDTLNIAGNAVTVQAGAETNGGVSVGTTYVNIQSLAVSWGSSASIWIFCQFRSDEPDMLQLDIRSGGSSILNSPPSFKPSDAGMEQYLDMFQSGLVSGAFISFWLKRANAGTSTIRNRKLLVLAAKR